MMPAPEPTARPPQRSPPAAAILLVPFVFIEPFRQQLEQVEEPVEQSLGIARLQNASGAVGAFAAAFARFALGATLGLAARRSAELNAAA